jgi:hypothetical protein
MRFDPMATHQLCGYDLFLANATSRFLTKTWTVRLMEIKARSRSIGQRFRISHTW